MTPIQGWGRGAGWRECKGWRGPAITPHLHTTLRSEHRDPLERSKVYNFWDSNSNRWELGIGSPLSRHDAFLRRQANSFAAGVAAAVRVIESGDEEEADQAVGLNEDGGEGGMSEDDDEDGVPQEMDPNRAVP